MLTTGETERYYFEMFLRDYPLPSGDIEYGDKPDIILAGERRLGIEITRLYVQDGDVPGSEQVQSKLRDSLVANAQRLYERSGGKPVELSIGFNKSQPILDKVKVAHQIAAFANRVRDRETGQVPKREYKDIPELQFVYLYAKPGRVATWRVMQVHDHGLMSLERLQEIVARKEVSAAQYKACDSYWLLVIVDFLDAAQEQEIRLQQRVRQVQSRVFEKVLVYKPYFGHIFEGK